MILNIHQKSPFVPTIGKYLVFIPKIPAIKVNGKTITEKIVKSFTISLVRVESKDWFVESIDINVF